MDRSISNVQWCHYDEQGYVNLGRIVSDDDVRALRQRIDEIMLGRARLDYDRMLMQEDSRDGVYGHTGPPSRGHKGSHLNYRKIEQLEFDPLFLRYMQRAVFEEACERVYGAGTPIRLMRAMFMNKPAKGGTFLPWHQDIWTRFDRHPLLTVWLALDPSNRQSGGVRIIPGSHKRGHINPGHSSGFLTPEMDEQHCPEKDALFLEMEPGEVALLHNYLLHSSDTNHSAAPRRAFSACYMDGRTVDERGTTYSLVFSEGAIVPDE